MYLSAPAKEDVDMAFVYENSIIDEKIQRITSKESQRIILNEYFYFDEKKFLNEIPQFIDQLGINDEFETSLKDKNLEKIKFILVENFYEALFIDKRPGLSLTSCVCLT